MFPTWSDWDITYTSKGLAKRRFKKLFSILAYIGIIAGIVRVRRSDMGVAGVKTLFRDYVRTALLRGAGVLQGAEKKIAI